MKNLLTKEWLKRQGLKNPPIDSGISGGGDAPRVYVSDAMQSYADEQTAPLLTRIAELEKDKWVSVDERLPEHSKNVLVYRSYGWQQVAYYINKGEHEYWVSEGVTHLSNVTHWQPLPQPPIAKAALEGTK